MVSNESILARFMKDAPKFLRRANSVWSKRTPQTHIFGLYRIYNTDFDVASCVFLNRATMFRYLVQQL